MFGVHIGSSFVLNIGWRFLYIRLPFVGDLYWSRNFFEVLTWREVRKELKIHRVSISATPITADVQRD